MQENQPSPLFLGSFMGSLVGSTFKQIVYSHFLLVRDLILLAFLLLRLRQQVNRYFHFIINLKQKNKKTVKIIN